MASLSAQPASVIDPSSDGRSEPSILTSSTSSPRSSLDVSHSAHHPTVHRYSTWSAGSDSSAAYLFASNSYSLGQTETRGTRPLLFAQAWNGAGDSDQRQAGASTSVDHDRRNLKKTLTRTMSHLIEDASRSLSSPTRRTTRADRQPPVAPPSSPTMSRYDIRREASPEYDQEEVEVEQRQPKPNPPAHTPSKAGSNARHPRNQHFLERLHIQPSLILENSGSVARDHLASERTFLAYVRTSLAIASTGVALVQLFTIATSQNSNNTIFATAQQIQKFARPLGAIIVIFGLCVLVIGIARFFAIQSALIRGKFPVARLVIGFMSFFLSALIVVVFGILVSGRK